MTAAVFQCFIDAKAGSLNYKQVASMLNITNKDQRTVIAQLLDELEQKGKLKKTQRGQYEMVPRNTELEGYIDITKKGAGFLRQDSGDIFIPPGQTMDAFSGDYVSVRAGNKRRGKRPEGRVIKVLERTRKQFVGVVQQSKDFAFVVSNDPKVHVDFFVPNENLGGARDGQLVVIRMVEWRPQGDNPIGEIVEVLGTPGENDAEIHGIMAEFELPMDFPARVEKAANKVAAVITDEEIAKRRDMRSVPTLTIDPVDAKDFDDALSMQRMDNGNLEVGVHIADVSHYVRPGDVIDREASGRAFSVYLVDRVVPMLPERLSNELCSLRPNEDKLAFSAVFELDDAARVVSEWFGRTVIRSDHRFTYEQAQEILDGGGGPLADEVKLMNGLAQKLRKTRMKKGALAIESSEVRFQLDDAGAPIGVELKTSGPSNKLIEEFMLLANKRVAMFIDKGGTKKRQPPPGVYRVHDLPDEERLKDLSRVLFGFGIRASFKNVQTASADISKVLEEIEDAAVKNMVQRETIKSMAKAVYSVDNIGHYGLGFSHYSHFTSPIRRYPDLLTHRILEALLADQNAAYDRNALDKLCKHSSMIERKAIDAERASIKFKQAEYMAKFVGEKFDGVVSGVTEWGFFVQLENHCEGLVHISSLEDDYYYMDAETRKIVATNTEFELGLGDEVVVRVLDSDLALRRVDLSLIHLIKPD